MKLYLIGMPGSGKTTIGRKLAKELNLEFIDLDVLIEQDNLMFIEEIFEVYGEKTFRELETKALTKVMSFDNVVVATGGGVITVKSNKELMNGTKFYIDTKVEIIEERIKSDIARPLLQNNTLESLYDARFLQYRSFADIIVSNNTEPKTTVKVIMNYLKDQGLV